MRTRVCTCEHGGGILGRMAREGLSGKAVLEYKDPGR